MMICPICMAVGEGTHCAYHVAAVTPEDNWAAANKVMCDFVHRGKALVRLAAIDRLEPGEVLGEMPPPVEVVAVAESYDA
jgi:hypothetical protein